jgi:hypothetical protein
MVRAPQLWDRYDEALDTVASATGAAVTDAAVRTLARAAAALITHGQLTDDQVLDEATTAGLGATHIEQLRRELDDLI